MYYPKQIPYLLDKEFQDHMEYKEYQIAELSEYCMCIWTMRSKDVLNKTIYNYILPDACIDIVIDFTNQTISFAGFSKETIPFELHEHIDFMGVRLKPGAFYALFGIPADQIMDQPIPFCTMEPQDSLVPILHETTDDKRITILKNYLLAKIKGRVAGKTMTMIDVLYACPKEQSVIKIAEKYGYSERQLYRLCKIHYGISMKVLLNILRLHLCLTLMMEQTALLDIAHICGFYDQSHFIKEIKKYTGFSPIQLLDQYR